MSIKADNCHNTVDMQDLSLYQIKNEDYGNSKTIKTIAGKCHSDGF